MDATNPIILANSKDQMNANARLSLKLLLPSTIEYIYLLATYFNLQNNLY